MFLFTLLSNCKSPRSTSDIQLESRSCRVYRQEVGCHIWAAGICVYGGVVYNFLLKLSRNKNNSLFKYDSDIQYYINIL